MNKKITLILAVFFSFSAFATVSQAEKEILIKLNQATNGHKWINKWDLSLPMNKWYGVKIVDDKVISINLNNNNLTGRIPIEITSLLNLQELNLTSAFRTKDSSIITQRRSVQMIWTILCFELDSATTSHSLFLQMA